MLHTRIVSATTLVTVATVFGGCGGSSQDVAGSDSAQTRTVTPVARFLTNSEQLSPSAEYPGSQSYVTDSLREYHVFMLDPVVVLPQTTARGLPLTDADRAMLAADFESELRAALAQTGHRVVTEPGPGVARIRSAVTEVAVTKNPGRSSTLDGGAAAELEIVDSLSDKRLAAAIDNQRVHPSQADTSDAFAETRIVFRHWASRLARTLTLADAATKELVEKRGLPVEGSPR
jgi:hypothetical protein